MQDPVLLLAGPAQGRHPIMVHHPPDEAGGRRLVSTGPAAGREGEGQGVVNLRGR